MAFPAPTAPGFPTPEVTGIATPEVGPNSYFGITPAQQAMGAGSTTLMGTPTQLAPSAWDIATTLRAQALSNATGGALQQDPTAWTPQEAAAQSDRAIARIAQVNPELAQSIQEKRTGQQQPGQESGGFLHDVTSALGAVLHNPVVSTVFDLLSRPAHIIPEILADEEGQSVWGNVAQALAGHSDKGWGQVLDKWGVLTGDDFASRFLHNGLAFIGDVATDPTTYLMMGAGAIGKEALMRVGAEATTKAALIGTEDGAKAIARMASTMGVSSDEAFSAFWTGLFHEGEGETTSLAKRIAERVAGKTETTGSKAVEERLSSTLTKMGLDPDAMPGVGHALFGEAEKQSLLSALQAGDRAAAHIGEYGAGALRNSEAMQKFARQAGIPLEQVQTELEAMRKAGTGLLGVSKESYDGAKSAAALMGGGLKFRGSLPVFQTRFVTNALPFTEKMNFQVARRFMAGISGYTRLTDMVANKAATMDHFEAFLQGGFSGLKKFSMANGDDVAHQLTNGFLHAGSMFYPMSEKVGGFTAHFAGNAKLLRGGGLGALIQADATRSAPHMAAAVHDRVMSVIGRDGKQLTAQDTQREMLRLFNIRKLSKENPEQLERMFSIMEDYNRLLPTQEAHNMGPEAWYDQQISELNKAAQEGRAGGDNAAIADELALLRQQRAKAVAARDGLVGMGEDVVAGNEMFRQVMSNADEQLSRGQLVGAIHGTPADNQSWLNREDATAAAEGSHDSVANIEMQMDDPSVLGMDEGKTILGEDQLTNRSLGGHSARGFNVSEVPDEENVAAKAEAAAPPEAAPAVPEKTVADVTARKGHLEGLEVQIRKLKETAARERMKGEKGDAVLVQDTEQKIRDLGAEADAEKAKIAKLSDTAGSEALEAEAEAQFLRDLGMDSNAVPIASDEELLALARGDAEKSGGVVTMAKGSTVDSVVNRAKAKQRFLIRLRRPFVRDLREGGMASTQEVDVVADVERQVHEALDLFKQDGKVQVLGSDEKTMRALSPDARAIIEGEMNDSDKVAEAVSTEMKKRGYDGIVTIDKEGKRHATVFAAEDGGHPIWGLSDNAPRAPRSTAGTYRTLRSEVEEAVRGVANEDGRRQGSEKVLLDIERATAHMGRREAEQKARRMLSKAGVTLKENQRVFESDPLKVADRLAAGVGQRVMQDSLGRTGRLMQDLGLTRSPWQSKAVGIEKYMYRIQEADYSLLGQLGEEVKNASKRVTQLEGMVGVWREGAEAADQKLKEFRAAMGDRIDELHGIIDSKGGGSAPSATMIESNLRDAQKEYDFFQSAGAKSARTNSFVDHGQGVVSYRMTKSGDKVYAKVIDGKVVATRRVTNDGFVTAVTHPGVDKLTGEKLYQGKGHGSQLLHQHWTDAGVYDSADPLQAAKTLIERQSFTGDGKALNHKAIRDLVERHPESKLAQLANEGHQKFATGTQELQDMMNELNRMKAGLHVKAAEVKPALVPRENAANMTGMEALNIPGFRDVAMPSFMANEFNRASRGYKHLSDFNKDYRKLMSWWKSWATFYWPGFHVRNIMGGMFNNWLGGVTLSDYHFTQKIRRAVWENTYGEGKLKYTGKAIWNTKDRQHLIDMGLNRTLSKDALKKLTYDDLGAYLSDLGINAANGRAFAEARVGSEHLASQLGKQSWFERASLPIKTPKALGGFGSAKGARFGGELYVKAAKGAGSMTENMLRTAAWVRGMKTTGGDVWGARAFTMLRHGDYADLTDWEYGWVRDIMPFYKWMRTNTPFQIHQLFESPGKLLAVSKARNDIWGAMGLDFNKEKYKEPEWMRDAIQLPTKLGPGDAFNVVMLDLPMNDLFTSGRDLVSSFLPMVRPFLESYITKQETFTGRPLGAESVPLSPLLGPVAPLLRAVGLGKSGAEGGTYISQGTSNILNAIPMFSRFRNWMYEDPKRVSARGNTLASAVFGLQLRGVDEAQMASNELEFYYNNILPQTQYLKSIGYELPTTDDLGTAVGDTNTVLKSVGITPGTEQYQMSPSSSSPTY